MERKTKRITVRFTETERDMLADRKGSLTWTQYFRKILLKKRFWF